MVKKGESLRIGIVAGCVYSSVFFYVSIVDLLRGTLYKQTELIINITSPTTFMSTPDQINTTSPAKPYQCDCPPDVDCEKTPKPIECSDRKRFMMAWLCKSYCASVSKTSGTPPTEVTKSTSIPASTKPKCLAPIAPDGFENYYLRIYRVLQILGTLLVFLLFLTLGIYALKNGIDKVADVRFGCCLITRLLDGWIWAAFALSFMSVLGMAILSTKRRYIFLNGFTMLSITVGLTMWAVFLLRKRRMRRLA